ncbi:MAG: SDR family oxidoreductase, partial [Nevskiales bacterium]
LPMDITDPEAGRKIADFFKEKFGGVDIVVHNAGVTRDKTLANMKEQFWDMVLNINLASILRINEVLLGEKIVNKDGRIVCLSSIGGIAGNMGQTNYGATKAGLIGYVKAASEGLAGDGICINAVAPGFIETRMTAEIPFVIREAGRRLCSLSQGGQPGDVAELITFLSSPGAVGVTGQTIRVCGQNLMGA